MYDKNVRKNFLVGTLCVTAVTVACFIFLSIEPLRLLTVAPTFVGYIITNFFPPGFGNVQVYAEAVLHTVAFAVVSTCISAVLSFAFALLMSDAIMPFPAVRIVARLLMTFMRNIPVIIWVSLMVFIFGIGSMVGLVALVLATTGFLSRSYAESISEIAAKKLEPLRASGLSTPKIILHGLLPEFTPAWVNWTLFTFEINIRASAILGMVGAGGMGVLIQTHLNLRNFNEVATLILMLISIVIFTEFLAGLIRKKIINSGGMQKTNPKKIQVLPAKARLFKWSVTFSIIAFFLVSLNYLNLDIARFVGRLNNFPRIMRLLLQANPDVILPGLRQFLVSFAMGVVGLVLGGILAVVLAFLAADNIAPFKPAAVLIKAFVSIVRAVPSLVIILMIVAAIGFGYTTGVVGLTLSSAGYLTKAFIATIEEQKTGVITAMRTTGASWAQIVVHGLFPAVATGFLAWIAIRLETSVAESVSLGVVGAGGIGTLLSRAIRQFDYSAITVLILIIFCCMFCLELVANTARNRIEVNL
ncbi:MAG: ABC transporter permease subunit [Defluviitaleaceae bacterium]|nr:ABC transporter permease subunit [Defluviitaleaceae bacterium]